MNIRLTVRKLTMLPDAKAHAKDRFSRLEKFSQGIQNVEVVLRGGERQVYCEAIVRIDSRSAVIVEVGGETVQAAVDLAAAKCERQLRIGKERSSGRRRRGEAAKGR